MKRSIQFTAHDSTPGDAQKSLAPYRSAGGRATHTGTIFTSVPAHFQ